MAAIKPRYSKEEFPQFGDAIFEVVNTYRTWLRSCGLGRVVMDSWIMAPQND